MKLKREDAAATELRVREIDALLSVDRRADGRALGYDLVRIPFPFLHELVARLIPQEAAAVLLVQLAPPADADVGLRALHVAAGQRFAAELDAAVAAVGDQLDHERQSKIAGEHVAAKELVLFQARAAADDLAV